MKTGADGATIARQDVLIGEVWVCSGQSNMAMNLAGASNGQAIIAAAGDKQLRLFGAGAHPTDEPQESIGGSWDIDSPQRAGGFSAVGYFFGLELRKSLGVPVGLIQSAVGGTVAEAWTTRARTGKAIRFSKFCWTDRPSVANYPKVLEAFKERGTRVAREI